MDNYPNDQVRERVGPGPGTGRETVQFRPGPDQVPFCAPPYGGGPGRGPGRGNGSRGFLLAQTVGQTDEGRGPVDNFAREPFGDPRSTSLAMGPEPTAAGAAGAADPPNIDRPSYPDAAACAGYVDQVDDLWFSSLPPDQNRAIAICRCCPVRSQCLAGALARGERYGIWGGRLFGAPTRRPPRVRKP